MGRKVISVSDISILADDTVELTVVFRGLKNPAQAEIVKRSIEHMILEKFTTDGIARKRTVGNADQDS